MGHVNQINVSMLTIKNVSKRACEYVIIKTYKHMTMRTYERPSIQEWPSMWGQPIMWEQGIMWASNMWASFMWTSKHINIQVCSYVSIQCVTNSWVKLILKNWLAKEMCSRVYKHMVKLTFNLCGTLES